MKTNQNPKMEVVNVSIDAIKPYWRNARNNDNTIEALKRSILEYGFNQPLVLDKNHVIIAGHSRYKAARQVNMLKVPCVIVDLSEEKAKEYRIADNKVHELSDWDTDKLLIELREIGNLENMAAFFPDVDLAELVKESAGVNSMPVTQETVDKVKENLANQINSTSNAVQENYKSIACPHCGEPFTLSQKDIDIALK